LSVAEPKYNLPAAFATTAKPVVGAAEGTDVLDIVENDTSGIAIVVVAVLEGEELWGGSIHILTRKSTRKTQTWRHWEYHSLIQMQVQPGMQV